MATVADPASREVRIRSSRRWRLSYLLAIWAALTAATAGPDLVQFARERTAIARLADSIAGDAETPSETAQRIAAAVRTQVQPGTPAGRSFLRETAWETWTAGRGACGEAARVMVNLLLARDLGATRINLAGPAHGFYHTAVAYKDGKEWRLIDTIAAPAGFHEWAEQNTLPINALLATSVAPGGAPVSEVRNPFFDRFSYVNWSRLTGPAFEVNQHVPPPRLLSLLLENPPLLRGTAKLVIAGIVLLLLLVTVRIHNRRQPHG